MFTPKTEKVRQIKKTFDEDEAEELNDLYGTFGLKRESGGIDTAREHRIQNVTEATTPFRSSSAVLRDLALHDMRMNDRDAASSSPTESSSWWEGGMAAFGRAAKAVIEVSPPPNPVSTACPSMTAGDIGVRKAKSNIELSSGTRMTSGTIPQEQRIPARADMVAVSDESIAHLIGMSRQLRSFENDASTFELPPPPAHDDEAFGYRPLPDCYEAQSEADDSIFDVHDCDQGSLIYGGRATDSPDEEDDEEDRKETQAVERDLDLFAIAQSSGSNDIDYDLGRRIMVDAREYDDEIDSPPTLTTSLPDAEEADIVAGSSSNALTEETVFEAHRPLLKYADRATKLRIAKSTPALPRAQAETSWFGSLRQALVGAYSGYEPIQAAPPIPKAQTGPLRITPSTAAAPSLVTKSNVLCDSASDGAIDLPPVNTIRHSSSNIPLSIPLRLRPSIARLKQAVFPPAPVSNEATTPTLSPRVDWDSQGEHYAGWNWSTKKPRPIKPSTAASASIQAEEYEAPGDAVRGSIDYTKSFFYKPATPPRRPSPDAARPVNERSSSEPQIRARRSIKSLKAALLLPVAAPPVPAIPAQYSRVGGTGSRTPPRLSSELRLDPPALAIQSPGSWEAGLPPRALVLEGEEWDARDGRVPGDWGRKASRKSGSKKLKKKSVLGDR